MSIKSDVERFAVELIRVKSLSGEEGEAANLALEQLSRVGVDDAYIDKYGNVVAKVNGSVDLDIVFEGHLDHVPSGDLSNWSIDPYSGTMIDGKIFGRGSSDMKGAIASMIASIPMLPQGDMPNIYYVFVNQEEVVEGLLFKYAIEETLEIEPDLVVLGEGTNLNISLGQRGRCVLNIDVYGESSHASMPEKGINALVIASKIINKLIELNERLPIDQRLGRSTLTPTTIKCQPEYLPVVPDFCSIQVDRRFVPSEDEDAVLGEIRRELTKDSVIEVAKSINIYVPTMDIFTWNGVKLRSRLFFPAWITDIDSFLKKLLIEVSANTGKRARFMYWRFSTDGVYSAGEKGYKTIGIGPGEESLAHRPDEYVKLDHLVKAAEIYSTIPKLYLEMSG